MKEILLCSFLCFHFTYSQYLTNNKTINKANVESKSISDPVFLNQSQSLVKEVAWPKHAVNSSKIITPHHKSSANENVKADNTFNKTDNSFSVKNQVYFNSSSYGNWSLGKLNTHLMLDPEWDYDTDTLNTTQKIPYRIMSLYNARNITVAKDKFHNIGCVSRILFNNRSSKPHIIKFNLKSLKEDERILDVELLYYFSPEQLSSFTNRQAVLRVYQLLSSDESKINNITNLRKNIDVHKLLSVAYVSYTKSAWQVFKIKKAIENWLSNEKSNNGIVLTLSSFNEQGYIQNVILDDRNENQFRTFLIVTTGKKNGDRINKLNPRPPSAESSCKKTEYQVDFTKLGHLNKIIITPSGYMAYDCGGSCSSSPLTNHMKMLITSQNFTRLARHSYCVPTHYLSLPIMYYDRYGNIVIKIYGDMAVQDCGCR